MTAEENLLAIKAMTVAITQQGQDLRIEQQGAKAKSKNHSVLKTYSFYLSVMVHENLTSPLANDLFAIYQSVSLRETVSVPFVSHLVGQDVC